MITMQVETSERCLSIKEKKYSNAHCDFTTSLPLVKERHMLGFSTSQRWVPDKPMCGFPAALAFAACFFQPGAPGVSSPVKYSDRGLSQGVCRAAVSGLSSEA